MKILIKKAEIVDPSSPYNGQITDLFIEQGIIRHIGDDLSPEADRVIEQADLKVSAGWLDLFANFGDPGYEFKETLESGSAAAAAGGYTDVMVIPNTNPVVHNKSSVEYIRHKTFSQAVQVHPIGAVTRNAEGKELAEMYDMRNSGAVAFGDGIRCIQSSGLLVKALQYVKAFGGVVIQLPDDQTIAPQGLMNESIVSTRLGLPGKPAMAEELIVARDLELNRYAGSRLHITGISTAKSLELIREARKEGVDVTCSVTPYHLYYCDEDLQEYDTNLKVNPPLRSRADRDALRAGVIDGSIDCLASHHLPHEYDSKVLEFEYAKNGMTGLETCFSVLITAVPALTPARIIELLSLNPRRIFRLNSQPINVGSTATLTLFATDAAWLVAAGDLRCKSSNNPFVGQTLRGRVAGIISGTRCILNS